MSDEKAQQHDQRRQAIIAFARALDHDDFAAAEGYLSDDCVYESPGGTIRGAAEIIASYRVNSEWAHRTFDTIEFDSEVDPIDPIEQVEQVKPATTTQFRITYLDRTLHRGQRHEYRCRQIVTVGDGGKIVHVAHEEIPGEREKLEAYFQRVGVTRDES